MHEFNLQVEWFNFELHPETPVQGVPKSTLFPGHLLDRMHENLNNMGALYGIGFGRNDLLSNSRKAIEAGEFARDKGKFELFHEKVFQAYFVKGMDIGNEETLAKLAGETGLNPEELRAAWERGDYLAHLEKSKEDWSKLHVTGIPTFVVDGKNIVVGAQPIEEFRNLLAKAE